MTQKEVAEVLEMPKSTYAHYEDGSNEPKISVLIKIADYYNVSVDWLIGAETKEPKNSPPVSDEREAFEAMLDSVDDETLLHLKNYLRYLIWLEDHPGEKQD